jgi:hypothetical protein
MGIRISWLIDQKLTMSNERSGFDAEKLPQAWVHFPIASLTLLPSAQGTMYQLGGGGLREPGCLAGGGYCGWSR